jgi:hypothetical protein
MKRIMEMKVIAERAINRSKRCLYRVRWVFGGTMKDIETARFLDPGVIFLAKEFWQGIKLESLGHALQCWKQRQAKIQSRIHFISRHSP